MDVLERTAAFCYAVGWTQRSVGVQSSAARGQGARTEPTFVEQPSDTRGARSYPS